MQDHKKFLDDYRSVLDRTWHPAAIPVPGGPSAIFPDPAAPAGEPATGLPSAALSHEIAAQADVRNPTLGPPELPNVNAQALGQTRPTPSLPTVEPTRMAPLAPSFDAPRRAFR